MKFIPTVLLIFFLAQAHIGRTQEPILSGEKHVLKSAIMGEEREIWVGLPTRFDSTKSYPTIYVMDAEWLFDITYALSKELETNDKIPKHIVIGIPNIDYKHRFKDLTFTATKVNSTGEPDSVIATHFNPETTGGGAHFYKYLTSEVIPYVEQTFPTNGFDIFLGHSLSGYFGGYILPMNTTFNSFQLHDPSIWYNNGDVTTKIPEKPTLTETPTVFISTAAGGKDRQQFNIDQHHAFNERLKAVGIKSARKVYPNEDHGSVKLPGIIDGLAQLYEGFSIGYISPTDTITTEEIIQHYRRFSEKINYTFICPPETFRWTAFANYTQQKWTEALKAYNHCIEHYTNNPTVCKEMAECYFALNEWDKSLTYYQKAYALDASDETIPKRIKEIKAGK